jgi:hypothetical protein
MKTSRSHIQICLLGAGLMVQPAMVQMVQAQFNYSSDNGAITITGYTGSGGAVSIPDKIKGQPVTSISFDAFQGCTTLTGITIPDSVTNIGQGAFNYCTSLTSVTIPSGVTLIADGTFYACGSLTNVMIPSGVISIGVYAFADTSLTSITIPNSVTSIGNYAFEFGASLTSVTIPNGVTNIGNFAFEYCTSLTNIYFQGNSPGDNGTAFLYDTNAIIYFPAGTTGWGSGFGGVPTWNPQVQTGDASFGVNNNQFGFNIAGNSNLVVIVEACTNLVNAVWSPVATNIITGGVSYFNDSQWTNYHGRFYRLRSQ